tara:strand:+ start:195 stop:395 length:201 start_codon:yes stop_codon:yes gene_type:complete
MNDPNLTAAECDALIQLVLTTPNRLTDKFSDDFKVNFRTIRKKLGYLADRQDGISEYQVTPYGTVD